MCACVWCERGIVCTRGVLACHSTCTAVRRQPCGAGSLLPLWGSMAVPVLQFAQPMPPFSEVSYWPFPPYILRQGLTGLIHLIQLGWEASELQGSASLHLPGAGVTGNCCTGARDQKSVVHVCTTIYQLNHLPASDWRFLKHGRVSQTNPYLLLKSTKCVAFCYNNLWKPTQKEHGEQGKEIPGPGNLGTHQSNSFGNGSATFYHYIHMRSPAEGRTCAQHKRHT